MSDYIFLSCFLNSHFKNLQISIAQTKNKYSLIKIAYKKLNFSEEYILKIKNFAIEHVDYF